MNHTTLQYLMVFTTVLVIFSFSSCKFYFEESEYLGTYTGSFESNVSTYKSCDGQLIVTDVGDHLVNLTLVTDSNPTFYFDTLKVQRGFSLASDNLRIDNSTLDVWINRNSHHIRLSYHAGSSSYDYHFGGEQQ